MFNIEVDNADALYTIDNMIGQLARLGRGGISHELSDWQVHDMHRQAPFTVRSNRNVVWTRIRPHSRYETMRRRKVLRRLVRRHAKHPTEPEARRTSTRPILRAELLAKLEERLEQRLDKIKWKVR